MSSIKEKMVTTDLLKQDSKNAPTGAFFFCLFLQFWYNGARRNYVFWNQKFEFFLL